MNAPGGTAPYRGRVAVVTDSTAYLPVETVLSHGLTVVPLQVIIGGRSRAEGVDVSSADVAQALASWQTVTTSRPVPAVFAEVYRDLVAKGANAVVSVHLSGELSGTADSARLAARQLAADGIEVEVVDSRLLGLGLGFVALAAARAAAVGADISAVVAAAKTCADDARVWLYVDTLDHLRRGGRVSAAAAFVGSALSVKPLLHISDGQLDPFEKVRTSSRALARLEETVVTFAGDRAVDIGVQHLAAEQRAEDLALRLRERVPGVRQVIVSEVGAAVGAHVGPGMVGVAVAPAASTPANTATDESSGSLT